MLIKMKRERSHTEDRYLDVWLATAAGLLNAMALGAFGFFPSHMSGNTLQLSSEVSNSDLRDLTFLGGLLLAFVAGAVTARLAVISGMKNGLCTIFCMVLAAEGVALFFLSLLEIFFYSAGNNREVLVLLGFLMGVHNSTSTQLSDAGISLASVLSALLCRDPSKNVHGQKKQLKTHLTTIFSFLGGGIAGLWLFRLFGFQAMAMLGLALTLMKVRSRAGQSGEMII
ncbi:YoaK family protein [Candidatus Pantoea persica]|uniref:YoaK family protein n=1 Tax=Candidatus Pantoea persica TaxID=2518128 RepID=UPI00215D7541|nr:YoaK family protein [Candidatus Pantoea persica]MBA2814343.1 DUF1275 family protein [Candidatus Pantoea persica]